ncbi:hypothetical protein ACHAWF_007491, partial [Thalassiosira exigua]
EEARGGRGGGREGGRGLSGWVAGAAANDAEAHAEARADAEAAEAEVPPSDPPSDASGGSSASDENFAFLATNALLSLSYVILAALAAGLTMGMLSLDQLSVGRQKPIFLASLESTSEGAASLRACTGRRQSVGQRWTGDSVSTFGERRRPVGAGSGQPVPLPVAGRRGGRRERRRNGSADGSSPGAVVGSMGASRKSPASARCARRSLSVQLLRRDGRAIFILDSSEGNASENGRFNGRFSNARRWRSCARTIRTRAGGAGMAQYGTVPQSCENDTMAIVPEHQRSPRELFPICVRGQAFACFGIKSQRSHVGTNSQQNSHLLQFWLHAPNKLGYFSQPLALEIKRHASSDKKERQHSEQLLPLLVGHSRRHRLLVSLLLLNSLANEALPLFLDELLPGKYAAIIVSVTLVLFFGEIVPSAFFTGPRQVEVAAGLVPLVKAVMFVLTPIAAPIAKVLDRVLHDDHGDHGDKGSGTGDDNKHERWASMEEDVTEGNFYNRTELTALVRIQYESQLRDKQRRKRERALAKTRDQDPTVKNPQHRPTHHSIRQISTELTASHRPTDSTLPITKMPSIHRDEITMIEGALTMTTKRAIDVCTPLRRVYALPSDAALDENKKVEIWARGFSRVPVYRPTDDASADEDVSAIVGVLMVRQLIVVDSAEERPISTLPLATPSCIEPSMHLVDLINLFQVGGGRGRGGLHLAIVCARSRLATEALERGEAIPKEAGVVGIVTLEDVVEELLQEEIYDEADRDLELSQWAVIKWKAFVKRKKTRRAASSSVTATASEATPLLK